MKLLDIDISNRRDKKFKAIFEMDNGRKKVVHFGAKGMDDYTITKDKEQRERYRMRHKKDLKTGDPTKPGYLSYFILWGDSTDIIKNILKYKDYFSL